MLPACGSNGISHNTCLPRAAAAIAGSMCAPYGVAIVKYQYQGKQAVNHCLKKLCIHISLRVIQLFLWLLSFRGAKESENQLKKKGCPF
jgi:hypothetical protein